jgi:hypothetical protein
MNAAAAAARAATAAIVRRDPRGVRLLAFTPSRLGLL